MGGGVLLVLLSAVVFVVGGLLIRGQGRVRGLQWRLGWLLFLSGQVALAYLLFVGPFTR